MSQENENNDGPDADDALKTDDADALAEDAELAEDSELAEAAELAEDIDRPGDNLDPASPGRPQFIGQIVSKRHPVLIAIVMLCALFLAVGPLLYCRERNWAVEAVALYTKVCDARSSGRLSDDWLKSVSGPELLSMSSEDRLKYVAGLECLSVKTHNYALRAVDGRSIGPNRQYVLSLFKGANVREAEKTGAHVVNVFFPVVANRLVIDMMPVGR